MKPAILRSTLFNLVFICVVGTMCVVMLPTLFLPRKYYMATVRLFVQTVYALERVVLGLHYEVRGLEHLPKDGPYIVAAKHQSAYETMKLHILFKDPAVILKKELLSIPLWGLYLKKSDPIAIDRSTPDAAIESIKSGAQHVKGQGRPIVIFPQGTRVAVETSAQQKPYKVGVTRIQDATGLPIIPMALNAGLFWPRNSWFKSPGTVIFEFLEPIPAGMERSKLLAKLEKETEEATQSLINEAKEAELHGRGKTLSIIGLVVVLLSVFGLYSTAWFMTAKQIKKEYPLAVADLTDAENPVLPPVITGYPGKLKLFIAKETLQNSEGLVVVENLRAEGWPIPNTPIKLMTGPVEVRNFKWDEPLHFDSLYARVKYDKEKLIVSESALTQGEFVLSVVGTADLKQEPIPLFDMNIELNNHQSLLQDLAVKGVIDMRAALFMGAGLTSLADEDGVVSLPLHQKGQMLYAGPLPIMAIPNPSIERRNVIAPDPTPQTQPSSFPDPAASEPDWDSLLPPSP